MSNTNSVRKPTKRDMFNELLNLPGLTEEQKNFINHEIDLLTKKNSGEKKPTVTQVANELLKGEIADGIEPGRQYTVTEIIKEVPACAGLTNQKVSPLVNQMVEEGRLVKTVDKRRSYFALPSAESAE